MTRRVPTVKAIPSSEMYTAYFDESGHAASGRFVALAGFVARDEAWAQFDVAWNAALVRNGAPFLHTTDLTNFMREFEGWTEERRRALMADLMNAIHEAGRIAAVGAVMAVDDFDSLTQEQRARLRDPFFPLFQEVIDGASLEAYFHPPNVTVRMIYSQQDEFAGSARQLFDVMQGRNARIGELQFADMRTVPGLQAADLLSFEFARYYRNKRTRPDLPMRWRLRQILRQQRILNIHYLKTIPKWYLRLQLSPRLVCVLTSIGLKMLLAVPTYLDMAWFAWANRAPQLPGEDERQIRELERHDQQRRRRL
jgi:hypothetical protein